MKLYFAHRHPLEIRTSCKKTASWNPVATNWDRQWKWSALRQHRAIQTTCCMSPSYNSCVCESYSSTKVDIYIRWNCSEPERRTSCWFGEGLASSRARTPHSMRGTLRNPSLCHRPLTSDIPRLLSASRNIVLHHVHAAWLVFRAQTCGCPPDTHKSFHACCFSAACICCTFQLHFLSFLGLRLARSDSLRQIVYHLMHELSSNCWLHSRNQT